MAEGGPLARAFLPAYPQGDEGAAVRMYVRRFRLFATVFLVYLAYAFEGLHGPADVARAGALLVLFVALYLGPLPVAAFLRSSGVAPVLLAMAGVMGVFLVVVGPSGLALSTYLAIGLVISLPPRTSLPLLALLVLAVTFLPPLVDAWDQPGPVWSVAVPCLLTGVAMLLVRVGNLRNAELFRARREVERLAAEQERLRIARDLHDLLGHALTTVTVKAELASRLVGRDPQRAAQEMAEVAELARRGLADVRATVSGYREVSLVTELATAREVLRAAGISAELPAAVESVPADLRELFGWVVREGVTNAVRHSRARHLRVLLCERAIEVVDDGRGAGGPCSGNGLIGLRERAAGVGGTLDAGPASPYGFRLRVEVPA